MCFISGAIAYLGIFNLLNFPAGIVPITRCTTEDLQKDRETFPAKDMFHIAMKSVTFDTNILCITDKILPHWFIATVIFLNLKLSEFLIESFCGCKHSSASFFSAKIINKIISSKFYVLLGGNICPKLSMYYNHISRRNWLLNVIIADNFDFL